MNPSLVILSRGKSQGQIIPLLRTPFIIGRGAGCTLRPSSSHIGERHCALHLQDGKVFVEDLHHAEDTFLDDQPIRGTVEIRDRQRLRVGRLLLEVRLAQQAFDAPASPTADDEAATLLLQGHQTADDGWTSATPKISPRQEDLDPLNQGSPGQKPQPARPQDTTEAARKILKKYGKLEGLRSPKRKH